MQESLSYPLSQRKERRRLIFGHDIMPSYVSYLGAAAIILILMLHFLLVVLNSLSFDLRRLGKLGAVLYHYGEASGTNSRFEFFSPGISSQIRVRFTIKRAGAAPEIFELTRQQNREVDLRLGDVFDQFIGIAGREEREARELQRLLAASLASHVFGRFPEAQTITVSVEEYFADSLFDQQPTEALAWEPLYSVEFSRDKRTAAP